MDDATLLKRVAVEVMGWKYWSPNGHPSNTALYDADEKLQQPLTTDCNSAGRVVARMFQDGWNMDFIQHCKSHGWEVQFWRPKHVYEGQTKGYGVDADFTRAVMLAALKAVEVKP